MLGSERKISNRELKKGEKLSLQESFQISRQDLDHHVYLSSYTDICCLRTIEITNIASGSLGLLSQSLSKVMKASHRQFDTYIQEAHMNMNSNETFQKSALIAIQEVLIS
ncbi:hypothetical protein VNO77_19396 [Canavalia gladiata]|uniref:Uncharacterized protein n=1 Tax=Canavalia gladiata TaxID=3824 RepID=A0AAN9QIG3_CANGL